MRRGIVVSILLVLVLAGGVVADEATTNWQALILEDFDDPDSRWIVRGGKYLAVEDGERNYEFPFDYQIVSDVWPEAMGRPDSDTPGVLGVQASFTRRGYNYLEFIPVEAEDGPDGEPIPRGISIPGRPATIDLWAWGANYNYYLEVQVRDHRGVVHTFKIDDMGYGGWRNLEARIPNYIPRAVRFVPQRRVLELVKIVLWTRPDEAVDGFHFYLDQIKVLTDVFESSFDGEGLADPDFVQQTWDAEQRQ
ncbi:MAG: flagellar filament outer layer protein FlaA [Spirochaetales bacterium]|nr:flagellar filament outer layer protein FlaA [Spirochaetales bacterium]